MQSALGQLNDVASAVTILHRIALEAKADKNGGVEGDIRAGNEGIGWRSRKAKKSKQLKKAAIALRKLNRHQAVLDLKSFPADCRAGSSVLKDI